MVDHNRVAAAVAIDDSPRSAPPAAQRYARDLKQT
jgi:hypothetical protein